VCCQDQFDVIDFSDNEIHKLDNFPRMSRLSTIIACNNYISRIGCIGEQLSSLTSIVLSGNRITHFNELNNLSKSTKLEYISLLDNPIISKPHYRAYMVYKFPALKLLDFQKVRVHERKEATKLFNNTEGKLPLMLVL
jgi:U2 small nuclear ribonucleoprotein A'